MRSFTPSLAAIAGLVLATSASAAPITFIFTGFASGSIGNTDFINSAFTITAIGDTSNRQAIPNAFLIAHDSASIEIAGLGVQTISTGTSSAVNNTQSVAVFGNLPEDLALYIVGSDPGLATWDMLSSFGPISASSNTLQWSGGSLQTSGGELILNNQTGVGTFEAIVIPAPASGGVLALAGLAVVRRRR